MRNLTLIALLLGLAGCSKMGSAKKDPNVDYYTCTMHPSVKSQDEKAKCPICSMDLVPVMKKGADAAGHDHQHGGMAMPMGDGMLNSPGTIDSDYRGELKVILVNLSNETQVIEPEERIAQIVIAKHERVTWQEVSVLNDTQRGAGGFGSTGTK